MGAAAIAPPPGFVEDIAPPPGFVDDDPPVPDGFVEDSPSAQVPPESTSPTSEFLPSLAAATAKMTLYSASGAADVVERETTPVVLKGQPFRTEDKARYDEVKSSLLDLRDEIARTTEGGGGGPDPREGSLVAELRELEKAPRQERASGKLAEAASTAYEHYDADPNAKNVTAQIGRGAGNVLGLLPAMLTGPVGMPIAAVQGASAAYGETLDVALKGGTDEAAAVEDAAKAAIKTAPALAAYLVGGKLAGEATSELFKAAAPIIKGIAGTIGSTAANVGVGTALRAIEGEDWKPTIETLTMDSLFGLLHGAGEWKGASVQAKARAQQELAARSAKLARESQPVAGEAASISVRAVENGNVIEGSTAGGGKIAAVERKGTVKVVSVEVPEAQRGTGQGTELYRGVVDYAKNKGLEMQSDTTVEAGAVRVWKSLAKNGEPVVENPNARTLDDGTMYVPGLDEPVFSAKYRNAEPPESQLPPKSTPAPVGSASLEKPILAEAKGVELLPEQAEVAAPKLDVRRSPFALGISPDNKALTWVTKNVKRLFTATGDLPKETFEGWIERNGFVKSESRQVAYAARDLYNGLKKEFDISTTDQLTKGFEKVPPAFVKEMNRALLGEVDINTLPANVRAPLHAMRDHIDTLSQTMVSEGVIPASLQAKVADNLGVYMTRSYRVFDDPKWAESIPQDVRNRTRDFILSNLRKENPAATPENARAVMDSMLQDWKDQGSGALVKSGGKIGSKDLTSLITRKDIPAVIREFMGEYNDPLINYARSVTKAANLIGSQRFLNQVRAQGEGRFLFKDGEQPASHSALIAAEGSDVMAPLNGMRTTPEIAAAFREFGKSDPIKNGFVRALATLSGLAKSVKTVGSVMTQARNMLGQTYFFAMNGHFDMTKAAHAVKAVLADLGARDTPAGRAAYQRYLRLGIVDQSARASELRAIIEDAGLNDPGFSVTNPGKLWAKTAKKLTIDAAAKAYQVSDDLGKIIGFENELVRQRTIHPEWSEATLEAISAERIRNTYPTYSMVPEAIQKIRRLPIAPFASFAAETFRTAYHNLRYTIEDLQSPISAQKKAGAQRLAGQLAVVGSGYALSAISQAMLGMNAQDEDDTRRFMAPWDKDSQILFTGKENGKSTFVNLSFTNPYSYLTDPVVSVASGLRDADQLDEVMLRSMAKLLQPFTSEDIFASAIVDIARNTTQTGQRVFNPGDTPAKRWEDKLAHLLKTLEPGTLSRVKGKIIPAIKGETDRSGRQPDLSNEILSELTGFKTQTLDYKQAVGYRAREFKKMDDDADSIFREVAARRGSVSEKDLTEAYQRSARSKFDTWQSFYRDVQAAKRRGISDGDIRTAIEARGVSSAETSAVMSGKFIPPKVSPALGKQMKENKRVLPPAVTQEMQRASGLVLSGRFK